MTSQVAAAYSGPIIDAHVHLFPPDVIEDRMTFLERDAWFGDLFVNPPGGMASVDDLLTSMDDIGIHHSVIAAWPWRDPGICRMHNQFLARVCAEHPERLSWLCIVNPRDDQSIADIEWSVGHGAVGVGELNADAQAFDWRHDEDWSSMTTWCAAHDLPVMLHASEPVGHMYPGKGTATPERLLHMIAANPDLAVVAAHWGGGLPFYELMPEVAGILTNVTYDCAATTYLYRPQVFDLVTQVVGPERVIFGSDYPVLRPARLLRSIAGRELTDVALGALLHGTARRVYRLDPKDGAP